MLEYFLAQLVFSSFLCFDFPNTWEQGENWPSYHKSYLNIIEWIHFKQLQYLQFWSPTVLILWWIKKKQ